MPYKTGRFIEIPINLMDKLKAFKEYQGLTWVALFETFLKMAEEDAQKNPD